MMEIAPSESFWRGVGVEIAFLSRAWLATQNRGFASQTGPTCTTAAERAASQTNAQNQRVGVNLGYEYLGGGCSVTELLAEPGVLKDGRRRFLLGLVALAVIFLFVEGGCVELCAS